MSKGNPRDAAWARYYRIHTNVLASWNETNGFPPNCPCAECEAAEAEEKLMYVWAEGVCDECRRTVEVYRTDNVTLCFACAMGVDPDEEDQ